jgi:hypothetical protein
MTLSEVLEYGPIVAVDEDNIYLVTANGAYLNFWVNGVDGWKNTTCRSREKDMYETTAAQIWDDGKKYLDEVLREEDEESG